MYLMAIFMRYSAPIIRYIARK